MASRSLLRPLLRASTAPSTHAAKISTTATLHAFPYKPAAPPKPTFSRPSSTTSPALSPRRTDSPSENDSSSPRPKVDLAAAQLLASSSPYPPAPPTEIDWSRSYHGLGESAFPKEVVDILTKPLEPADIEVKPDGIIYLPEIKYRRILNAAFGPGAWGLVPRGDAVVGERIVTREYALVVNGRFVSQAQGENTYFALEGLPSAVEGCKSNALMRCCKDLGIASELWDPVFIREFRARHMDVVWVEHVTTKKKMKLSLKKGMPVMYPYKQTGTA